ncbi:MAG: hypothetical protein II839_12545, partial [Kiritimatiellae bacterium]|nr:hypothetical protein [Kiritimatiellia bacterium]
VWAYDCSAEGEIRGGTTGGLVGEASGGRYERCSFEGTMRPDRSSVSGCLNGGLVGEASNTVFRACTTVVELLDSKAASAGGAAAVTFGNTAFYDCSATVEAAVPIGRFGGFVGWTAGAEIFSNCTASLTAIATPVINYDAGTTNIYSLTTGGFAASVASDGALFVDCTASAGGGDLKAGFYYNQAPYSQNVAVGSNTFRRCHAVDCAASYAGFCSSAWNCAFEGCQVAGGTGVAGFVFAAGGRPDDSSSSSYAYEQTSTFEDCSVVGTRVRYGFVANANTGDKNGSTNVFRRCRAGGNFGYHASSLSGYECGFAGGAYKGSLFEDCVGYGLVTTEGNSSESTYGFAEGIYAGATVRRCVGALLPRDYNKSGAGFAQYIAYGATVEDCYSVYGPRAAAVEPYTDQNWRYGIQGGFVTRTHIGYREGDDPIARCFALWPLPVPQSGNSYCGAFCGVTPYADYPPFFQDCYRPAEAAVDDCHDADDENVAAFTAAQFANATGATMPNYDFRNVWHAPGGVASSPYLDASVNTNGEFWTFAAMASGEGRILVNGEAPKESYPAGSVLTIEAIPDNPDLPFTGWLGDNIADPASRVTTYTVRNVGAFGATFGIPIWTVDDWTNKIALVNVSNPRETYALMSDLDFTGLNRDHYYVGPFQGKFFGLGHTISGVVVTNGSTKSTFALFSSASSGAEIRDLTVESSTVTNRNNAIYIAGLVNEVGSGVLISNCHARADWQGCYTDWLFSGAYPACQFYGLAGSVSGAGIRIVDCSVEGTLAGMTEACGFVGSVDMNGGEIARCAVYANVSASTNRTGGAAAGFAGSLTLEGGAVVRECLAAGSVTASATGSGFANSITFRDSASSIRDCYSTMEVSTNNKNYYANGFADTISGAYDDAGALVTNCWFGGSVRGGNQQSAFARSVDDATLSNCRSVAAAGSPASATAGVASLAPDAARAAASWTGFDFDDVWSLAEGATTPYFAWSLTTNGAFRVLAQEEPDTVIAHPATAAPGGAAAIEAAAEDADLFFCQWAGGATYTNAAVNPSAALADNHRAVRCVWGKAISTPEQLAAIADDPAG